ncbi:cell division protein ZapB [Carboxylicivirga marina]|uniref:cell division protein ZapB n=1 Tax=Carboxylicivirga marina TaxID=2800988 RepID=UPI0025953D0E|nr:cell division protein ZapB [uncultured Carboxylicivirga sp.]
MKNKIISSLIIIVLTALCVYGFINSYVLNDTLTALQSEIQQLKEKNSSLQSALRISDKKNLLQRQVQEQKLDSLKLEHRLDSLVSCVSKFKNDSLLFEIKRISPSKFHKISKTNKSIKYEDLHFRDILEKKDESAWRVNDSIFIVRLATESLDTIKNYTPRKGELAFSVYKYHGFVEPLNSFLFAGSYCDYWDLFVINKATGKRTPLDHHIVISQDQKTLLSYIWDGWTFYSGGFKLYDISDGNLNIDVEHRIPEYHSEKLGMYWSLSDVYIIDKDNLVFKIQFYLMKSRWSGSCYANLTIKR